MNKNQSNIYRMFLSTQSYLDNNNGIWNGIPRLVTYKNDLDEVISRIHEKIQETKLDVGVTQKKDNLKDVIANKGSMLAGVIHVFALEQGNIDLANSVKLTRSDINRLKETDVYPTVKNVTSKASEHIEPLGEFGLTQELVTEVQTSIEDFNALIGKPRTILSQKYATLGSIEDLFTEGNQILKPKMDNMMTIFRDNEAEFYSGYLSARTIIGN
ncbi:hypothetical protein E9993_22285 [Labilibacter sediminis]|nr:hypothetical protein E9993_22285 [Labilibacter sediminis]